MEKNVIGITDERMPIVRPQHYCAYWEISGVSMIGIRECRYCRWSDFRKSADMTQTQSVCRCPENRVTVIPGEKNETSI